MVKMQLELPRKIDKKLRIYTAEKELPDKRRAVINILSEYLKV